MVSWKGELEHESLTPPANVTCKARMEGQEYRVLFPISPSTIQTGFYRVYIISTIVLTYIQTYTYIHTYNKYITYQSYMGTDIYIHTYTLKNIYIYHDNVRLLVSPVARLLIPLTTKRWSDSKIPSNNTSRYPSILHTQKHRV